MSYAQTGKDLEKSLKIIPKLKDLAFVYKNYQLYIFYRMLKSLLYEILLCMIIEISFQYMQLYSNEVLHYVTNIFVSPKPLSF